MFEARFCASRTARIFVGGLLIGLLPFVGSCIPVWRQTVVRPAGVIVARDAQSAAPIEHARVIVRRFNLGPPPSRQSHQYIAYTTIDGRAAFTAEKSHEWVMPLMMHGIPQWAFDVCVDAPGYQGHAVDWFVQGMWTEDKDFAPQPDLIVPLSAGQGSCEASRQRRRFQNESEDQVGNKGTAAAP